MDTHSDDHRPAGGAVALSIVLLALAALLLPAGPVRADFGPGTFSVALHDGAGTPATQAGAHADLTTAFSLNTATGPAGPVPDGTLKEARVDLPAGLYGDPGVVPQCTAADFNDYGRGCPVASQVGVMTVQVAADTGNPASFVTVPVFDMETVPGETAAFAAAVVGTPVRISVTVPAGNGYRLRASIRAINQGVPIYATTLTLWGVPADPSHDAERYVNGPLAPPGGASSQPRRPFLSAPPACAAAPQSAFSQRTASRLPASPMTRSATSPGPQASLMNGGRSTARTTA